mmetsp:Transcript_43127/g.59870  ORF Transcript_43127/g.59870 Transcript_43127/m.59870 type:complete len:255 (+) Transcript_43127:517-1281(+)
MTRVVHSYSTTSVHVTRPGIGDGFHSLHQTKCGRCFGHIRAAQHVLCGIAIEGKNRNLRGKLVDDVGVWERRVELDIPWAKGRLALGTRPAEAGGLQLAALGVEPELANEIHTQIRHVRDLAEERVQNDCVRVRIALPLLLRIRVVLRVVHVLFVTDLHSPALVGVMDALDFSNGTRFRIQTKNADGCIPVIDRQHVLALLVQCQVASGRAFSTAASNFEQLARMRVHGVCHNVSCISDRFRARVEQIPLRIKP